MSSDPGWRRASIIFSTSLLAMGIFHLSMWFAFTRHLLRPEVGDLKRMGYLVGLEDHKPKFNEASTGAEAVFDARSFEPDQNYPIMMWGDSFMGPIASTIGSQTGARILIFNATGSGQSLTAQIRRLADEGVFRKHQTRIVMIELVEFNILEALSSDRTAWPDVTFAEYLRQQTMGDPRNNVEEKPVTFANNGNFKILTYNFCYLFSPNAFGMSATYRVPMTRKLFSCSYGDELLFYNLDLLNGLNPSNRLLEPLVQNCLALAERLRKEGVALYLLPCPDKADLYYPYIRNPFYAENRLLDILSERFDRTAVKFIPTKKFLRTVLTNGQVDLYYADDIHWSPITPPLVIEKIRGTLLKDLR